MTSHILAVAFGVVVGIILGQRYVYIGSNYARYKASTFGALIRKRGLQ